MAQLVVRNIEDETMQGLRELAGRQGVSTEQAVRTLIAEAVDADRRLAAFAAAAGAARRTIAESHGVLGDSTADVRADRDAR